MQQQQRAQQQQVTITPKADGGLLAVPGGQAVITAEDVRALRVRQNDLRDELQDAASRRNTIAGHLRDADIAARPGYEARLKVLDDRILTIENEITRVGRQLNAAPSAALVEAQPPNPMPDPGPMIEGIVEEIVPIVAIVSVFVLGPLAFAISRFLWKRSSPAPQIARADHATQERLEQLQQAVDAIAIEVERISEGQRYVTKVIGNRAVGAGDAEPVHVPRSAAVSSERR